MEFRSLLESVARATYAAAKRWSGQMNSSKFSNLLQLSLITVGAPAVLGYVVGDLTGKGVASETVYAAVIPAVISLLGFVVFSGVGTQNQLSTRVMASVAVAVFALALSCAHDEAVAGKR